MGLGKQRHTIVKVRMSCNEFVVHGKGTVDVVETYDVGSCFEPREIHGAIRLGLSGDQNGKAPLNCNKCRGIVLLSSRRWVRFT